MSLENAILEHAAAIRTLAENIVLAAVSRNKDAALLLESNRAIANGQIAAALGDAATAVADVVKETGAQPDPELEKAVANVEAAVKDMAESEAKKPAGAAESKAPANTAGSATAPDTTDAAPLDYAKDVTPKLLAFIKAHGKPAFVQLLSEFGATSGAQLKPEQYPAILARVAD